MNMAGQTINDRLLAARHSLAGQGLAKSVCKATTEEMIAPKKKHLDCKYTFLCVEVLLSSPCDFVFFTCVNWVLTILLFYLHHFYSEHMQTYLPFMFLLLSMFCHQPELAA